MQGLLDGVTQSTERLLGTMLIVQGRNGLPKFLLFSTDGNSEQQIHIDEQQQPPQVIEQQPVAVVPLEPITQVSETLAPPTQKKRGRKSNAEKARLAAEAAAKTTPVQSTPTPAPTVPESMLDEEIEVDDGEESAPATTAKKGGKKSFGGKPMTKECHPIGKKVLIRTSKGKEMEVFKVKDGKDGAIKVLSPDKNSEPPKGYMFGAVWMVKKENIIRYL